MSEIVSVGGHDVPKGRLLMIGAGAAVVLYLVVKSKQMPAPVTPAGANLPGNNTEFAMITAQASDQFAALQASTALEQRRIDSAFQLQAGIDPGLQRTCISFPKWLELDAATKSNLTLQVKRGTMIQTVTTQGVCFTPTDTGIMGYQQQVSVKTNRGFFSSGQTATGPPGAFNAQVGGPLPTSGLTDLTNSILSGILNYGNHTSLPTGMRTTVNPRYPYTPGFVPQSYA